MSIALASARLESRRLLRSGLLLGLVAAFAFFGLSGPLLASYLPEILGAASGSDQFTIEAAPATATSAITIFNQSAMQLGLILAVAVAITALSWDSRPGSSIFYRVRLRRLSQLTVPRLATGWAVVAVSYALGLALAAGLTTATIGPVPWSLTLRVGLASIAYLVMSMAIGHLIMTLTRRTAPAISVAAILLIVLPVFSQVPFLSSWFPTTLLTATTASGADLVWPALSAISFTVACVVVASLVATRQSLRRDA